MKVDCWRCGKKRKLKYNWRDAAYFYYACKKCNTELTKTLRVRR